MGGLIDETKQFYLEKGESGDVAIAISKQLPFFACNNVVLDKDCQEDISRYSYSKDFSSSPYPGTYGEQPKKWIEKSFLIKSTLSKIERNAYEKNKG